MELQEEPDNLVFPNVAFFSEQDRAVFNVVFLLFYIMQLLKRIESQLVYAYEPNTQPIVFFTIVLITKQLPLCTQAVSNYSFTFINP